MLNPARGTQDIAPLSDRAAWTSAFPLTETFGPQVVPNGHYFVAGDNRDNSNDSRRSLGTIPEHLMIGRALFVHFSWVPKSERPGDDTMGVDWSRVNVPIE